MKVGTTSAVILGVCVVVGRSRQSSLPRSAAGAACEDVNSCRAGTEAAVTSGKGRSLLANAVKEAPPESLFRDMSTLRPNVQSATAAKCMSLFTGERLTTLEDARQVRADCLLVNPSP